MRSKTWLCAIAITASVPAQIAAQQTDSIRGAMVRVSRALRPTPIISGELIALTPDSLWVLTRQGLQGEPLARVDRVTIKQHSVGPGTIAVWGTVAGVVSGGVLTGACSSVADDCGGVFVGTLLLWGVVTAISAASVGSSHQRTFRGAAFTDLNAYARFPQGWPDAGADSVRTRVWDVRRRVP